MCIEKGSLLMICFYPIVADFLNLCLINEAVFWIRHTIVFYKVWKKLK